jgi:chemotaxis protein CheD
MFPGQRCSLHVGRRNGEVARELLAEHGIRVVGDSLFGHSALRIAFDVATGEVWSRRPPGLALCAIGRETRQRA